MQHYSLVRKVEHLNPKTTSMKVWIWLQLVILVFLSPGTLRAASLRILTENLPPLNYVKNGALMGPSVEMVKEIQKRIGSREEIQVYPWGQGLPDRPE